MKLFNKSSRRNIRLRLIATILCIGLISGIVWLLLNPTESVAAWYDDSYAYRAKQTIGNTSSADSNKKVKLDIDTATLITAGKMQSDCDDTRFTDINGKQLQYFLDSAGGACNGASTDYYVLLPTINAGTTIMYMYYGNSLANSGSQSSQFSQATFSPTSGPTAATEEQGAAPRLYWKFDEGQGTSTNDTTKNNNTGTLGGSNADPSWQTEDQCVSGICLKFDGSNDYVSRTYSSDSELAPGTASFSVSVWFRHSTANLSGNNMLITRSASGVGYKVYMNSSEQMCFGVDDVTGSFPSDSACSTAAYNDSQWHFLEAVKSGTSSVTLYIDGNQVAQDASLAATGSLSASNPTLYVGIDSDGTSTPWDGFIDEFKYYDSARSSAQVQTDFSAKGSVAGSAVAFGNNKNTNLDSGLTGYWKMDESAANSCTGGTNDSCDSSGNVKDLAWSGTTTSSSGKFGNATAYGGTNDYANAGNINNITASDSLTISFWIYRTNTTSDQYLIDKKSSAAAAGSVGYSILQYSTANGGNTCLYVSDGTNQYENCTANNTTTTTSTWEHLIFTFDRSGGTTSSTIYKNGTNAEFSVYEVGNPRTVGSASNSLGLCFGTPAAAAGACNTSGTLEFTGRLDEVRMYNRSLSCSEVLSLYDWGPYPVGYWNLDERTGTTANDTSGNQNSGTLSNTTWKACKIGACITSSIDGTQNITTVTDPSSGILDFSNTQNFSYEAWIKATNKEDVTHPIRKGGTSSSVVGYYMQLDTGTTATCAYTDGNGVGGVDSTSSTTNVQDGNWHHIACVMDRDSTAFSIYVDGKLEASDTSLTEGSAASNPNNLIFGETSVSSEFDGGIDDVRIYNYSRTAKQIVQDMNGGLPSVGGVGSPANTIAYWNLDEGQGTTANDKSGRGNSLTLNTSTSAWTTSGKFASAWNGLGSNWLTRADDDDFDFAAAEDFSISLWVKSDSTTNPSGAEYVLSKLESSAGYRIRFNTSGQIRFSIDDDTAYTPDDEVTSTADIYDAAWHNVITVKNGTSRIDLYVDGNLVATDTSLAATGTLANAIALYLGDRNGVDGGDEFNGDIDEIKFYRYALNAQEVKAEFNQGSSQSIGSVSTTSTGTGDNSAAREYCVPGDATSCAGPVGDWKLDERTGTTAKDSSGNGLYGTLNGTTTWTTGKIGASVNYTNTSGEYIDIGDNASLDFGASADFTLEAWVNRAAAVEQDAIIEKKNVTDSCSADPGYSLYITTAGLAKFRACDAADNAYNVESTSTLTNGTWFHVVLVWDDDSSTGTRMYVNGKNDTGTVSGTITSVGDLSNALSLRIGSESDGGKAMNGKLDQVKIYNYARTPAQIAWSYNQGGPVAWYKFDECSGTTANDASANSNTGTISVGSSGAYTAIGTCNSGTSTEAWNAGSTGKFSSSIALDDTDDYVDLGDQSAMESISQASWTFWTNPSVTNACIFCKANSDGTQSAWRFTPGTGLRAYLASTSTNYGETVKSYINGSWVHAAVIFDGTLSGNANRLKIYLDGKSEPLTFSGTIPAATSATTSNARLNSYSNGSSFSRSLYDDVRMYNYPLTAVQVRNVYNEGSAVRLGQ